MEDLQTLVNIDSGTDNQLGLAIVEVFLAKRLKRLGAKVEVLAAPPAIGNIIVGRCNGKGSKDIMMLIHSDTVFERGEAAKRPFKIA